jgi:hypothetical protein
LLGFANAFTQTQMQQQLAQKEVALKTSAQVAGQLAETGQFHLLPPEAQKGFEKVLGKDAAVVLASRSQASEGLGAVLNQLQSQLSRPTPRQVGAGLSAPSPLVQPSDAAVGEAKAPAAPTTPQPVRQIQEAQFLQPRTSIEAFEELPPSQKALIAGQQIGQIALK